MAPPGAVTSNLASINPILQSTRSRNLEAPRLAKQRSHATLEAELFRQRASMTAYNEVLSQVKDLTLTDKVRLLEELKTLVNPSLTTEEDPETIYT
ncbi:MAG: hypothetical protein SW833_15150 [Cyanobacteriota bacterium]|nr:hypothetical protein [Cyanobacteriota bacterium]